MSEYQFIAFRAIDGPLSEENLAYMEQQSTRAEITPWSFENEYHFGDFRGDTLEMLRRGYDIHLHYANFGVRSLLIRLPHGFPDAKAAKPYLKHGLKFLKDKKGPSGTLAIQPFYEVDDLDELWDLDDLLDALIPLRSEILEGDLRPLYLAHLAVSCDCDHNPESTREAPVPAGLQEPTDAQLALAEFFGIGEALIAAAACGSEERPSMGDRRVRYAEWLTGQPETAKDAWLTDLLGDPSSRVRAEILAEFGKDRRESSWPTVQLNRTMAQLESAADAIQSEANRKAAAKAAREREETLAKMGADPTPYLRETERLVAQRTVDAYEQSGRLLADLRDALAGSEQAGLAEEQARKLKKKNPKRHHLIAALRRRGFVPK